MAHVNKKISGALFSIKQAKNILPKASLRTLYFALIEPHLSYGILVWGNANKKTLHRTEMLQKRAIRTVAVEVLGASTRVGHRSVHTAFLHVVTHQVTTWALCSLYKE